MRQKIEPSAQQPSSRGRRGRRLGLLLGMWLMGLVACVPEGTFSFQSDQVRLLFSAFPGRSFGTSFQAPVLVVAEYTGKLSGKACLLLQISYANTTQLVIQPNKGRALSSNDSDISDAVFKQYQSCTNDKRACLIGVLDKKTPELIAQVELLTPDAGGLLIGGLFRGDCSAEDTFTSTNILARQALAIGREFRNQESTTTEPTEPTETTGESAAEAVSEATADGGSGE